MHIYDEQGICIAVKLAGTREEFEKEFGSNIFISEIDLGDKAIIENGEVRAITRHDLILSGKLELLIEGEYIKDNEIIMVEKPNNFHFWDSNKNEWVYDQEVEINSLEEELGSLELEIYNKQNELKELKENNKTFAAKKLEKEVAELEKLFEKKMTRYEELEV